MGIRVKLVSKLALFCMAVALSISTYSFTDPADPQVADMDKEEARLNELNKRLSQVNETYQHIKKIHSLLVKHQIVNGSSSQEGALFKEWSSKLSALLLRLNVDVDKYIIDPANTNYDENEDAYSQLMGELRAEVTELKEDQHYQRLEYYKIESIITSINKYLLKTEQFPEEFLNEASGEDYRDFILQVNNYTQRITDAVYSLNNEMEVLAVNSINGVVDALIETLKITNEVYAIGLGDLSDTVAQARALIDFADFIQIKNKNIVAKKQEVYRLLDKGRIGSSEKAKDELESLIKLTKNEFEDEFVSLTETLTSNHPLYDVQRAAISNIGSAEQDYITLKNSKLWRASDLSFNMARWVNRTLAEGGQIDLACSLSGKVETSYGVYETGVLEQDSISKASIDCKVAKETYAFYRRNLRVNNGTVLTKFELDQPGKSMDDLTIDRIRLIEQKMDAIFVDEGV